MGALGVLLVTCFVVRGPLLVALNAAVMVFYLVSTAYRTLLIDLSLRESHELQGAEADDPDWTPPGGWPKYLVLVPLYHESEILPSLVAGLKRMEYPADRLEVRLLIEEDDEETRRAAEALDLQAPVTALIVPESYPRTKPKACNVGLEGSDAEFAVIYDAEDQPDRDQLRRAVAAFTAVPPEVACIQAKLNFYNSSHNMLTRWFTAEYAMWFDLCLPALDALQAPIPLGGTSNHFRMNVLRELGGWDEYNVTEDCDLGLRLFSRGYRTRILASTTWEQACPHLGFWIRQRSRWVKGYVQTYLVHLRSPGEILRKRGLWNWLQFHLLIGGTPFCQLVNPVYWLLALLWFVLRPEGLSEFFPGPVFAMGAICLFVGNFALAYSCAVATVRRGFGNLALYGLSMPLYWAAMSVAAWKGTLQLITRPHHWEKTRHFGQSAAAGAALEPEATE